SVAVRHSSQSAGSANYAVPATHGQGRTGQASAVDLTGLRDLARLGRSLESMWLAEGSRLPCARVIRLKYLCVTFRRHISSYSRPSMTRFSACSLPVKSFSVPKCKGLRTKQPHIAGPATPLRVLPEPMLFCWLCARWTSGRVIK